jgi:cytochrome c oxidase assembly protein subunit 15/protoheme IX farnesyltransferase
MIPAATAGTSAAPAAPLLTRWAWGVLIYNIFVILWGALVRATGSGAGCGEHWPLCNGAVVPVMPQMHTMIEFTHRATSGLALLAVIGSYLAFRKAFSSQHLARRAAFWSLILMINETLVGAALVILGLVAGSRSPWRAVVLSFHLINTLLLLGALTLTAWWSAFAKPVWAPDPRVRKLILMAVAAVLLTSAAGGIAALGDTLYPASTLQQGLADELSSDSPAIVRLRVIHPLLAVAAGAFLFWLAMTYSVPVWGNAILGLTLAQFLLGGLNIFLLTPVWTQLTHLLLTDLLWVSLLLFGARLGEQNATR